MLHSHATVFLSRFINEYRRNICCVKNCDGLASHSGKSRDSPGPKIQPIANWRFTRLEGRHYTHPFLPLLERNTKHFLTVHSYLTILDRQELKWVKEIRKDRSRFSEKKSGQLGRPLLSCSRIWRGSHGFALTGLVLPLKKGEVLVSHSGNGQR